MTLISVKIHTAAENAVREVSTQIYPVYLAVQGLEKQDNPSSGNEGGVDKDGSAGSDSGSKSGNTTGSKLGGIAGSLPGSLSIQDWAKEYGSKLPYPLSEWLIGAAEKGQKPLEQLKGQITEAALDPVMKPILQPYLEKAHLNIDRIHIVGVVVPDLRSGRNPYFGLELSYELPIRVPFTYRKISIQSKALERLWIGDTDELSQGNGNENGPDIVNPVIVQIPNPAFAGRRAVVKAKISPTTTASLTVYYKSGQSKAKYLGTATADENGIVEWEWLVGGNTTPGNWQLVVETPEGGRTVAEFTVESPRAAN